MRGKRSAIQGESAPQSLGFDCIVGNPPFAGKNTIATGNRDGFLDWLKMVHEESHGNADLVAHFFRRAFNLIRDGGTFGLIATNTIAQGDTRNTGLRWICTHGGTIYAARRRYKWPGQAAVVVSVVHVVDGVTGGACDLDGKSVERVSAYLFHVGSHDDPADLRTNAGKCFQGIIVLGMGFTFDDSDMKGVASPISRMNELLAKHPANAERISPYLGGEEINDDPTHAHRRYVINFGDLDEAEARRRWPELLRLVEDKVKPSRLADNRASYRRNWWQHAERRSELIDASRGIRRTMVIPFVAKWHAPAFVPASTIVAGPANVVVLDRFAAFPSLQCRLHELWVQFLSSSLEERQRYTPSDCFETFPFPPDVLEWSRSDRLPKGPMPPHIQRLEEVGKVYYEFRADLMVRNNEGLTKTYNRFHDPSETSPDIAKLRELHADMDRAVLDAYGWKDLAERATCEFLLDYEEEEDDEVNTGRVRKRKKPYRYRWPDDFRDEVLARLLALNKERAEGERAAEPAKMKTKSKSRKAKPKTEAKSDLFRD